MLRDKRFLGVIVNIVVSIFSLYLVAFLLNKELSFTILVVVIGFRILASFLLFDDYKLSWSKASTKTGLMKIVLALLAFAIYTPILYYFYSVPFNLLFIDVVFYTFMINILVYVYKYFYSIKGNKKTKSLVIYGAGKAGLQLQREFLSSEYKLICFIDDDEILHHRSIDGISIFSREKYSLNYKNRFDLMIIAMPSASQEQIKSIYESMQDKFEKIKILPSMQNILKKELFVKQLKDIGVEDLLARYPKDLDKNAIQNFIKDKIVLITGAGGSIGSEISRQCKAYGAKQLILVDHSEFNLYSILEELQDENIIPIMQSVKDIDILESTFSKYRPQIVIHAAAYKHVPLVEHNILEGITNNIIGTKNTIDLSIKYKVEKFVLISTDKAVRPTNVMGTTKRVCELYAQNVDSKNTEIVAVRFGNVLGSSGSVIPKFKAQIEAGKNITVTHPEITRYFMLIPEACELVLQPDVEILFGVTGQTSAYGPAFIHRLAHFVIGVRIVGNQRQVVRRTADGGELCPFGFHFPGLTIVQEARIGGDDIFLPDVKHRGGKGGGVVGQQIFHPAFHLLAGGWLDVFRHERTLRRHRRKTF